MGGCMAYKWELTGGVLTTIGILVSGIIHPIVLGPGVLYILYRVLNLKRTANN